MSLANCRVVLVRTQIAGNLGATARVMRNFGLSRLTLVAPQADPNSEEARKLSTHGEDILNEARVVATLEEALADCVMVAATSARLGGLFRKQTLGTPETVMPLLIDAGAIGPIALVFGPEPSGLTNEEISICHYLITIPADPSYPALNLAQAVAVCLYELHRAGLARNAPPPRREPIAPCADQERMFGELRSALEQIHFLYGPKADSLFHALRHLIGRSGPTAMEVDVLFGLARQIQWWVEQAGNEKPKPGPLGTGLG
jgi:tRNA/rRNA methyltransferase